MAKTYDKEKWLADSKVRVETAKKALEAGLAALQSGEDWKQRLAAMAALGPARLGRFSFRNALLVLLERPDARHVATFGTWRKLGRSVAKGSKALTVLQPRFAPKDTDEEAIGTEAGATKLRRTTGDGRERAAVTSQGATHLDDERQKLVGFKPL